MNALVVYATQSGNTQEVAEVIHYCIAEENSSTVYRIGSGTMPDPSLYDVMILGSFTWSKGATPDIVKDFVADLGYKPPNVYIFGTGDTQFGGDALFCKASDKLAKFYSSTYPVLKIEQFPTEEDYTRIIEWTKGIIKHVRS